MTTQLRAQARDVLTAEGFAVDIGDAGRAEVARSREVTPDAVASKDKSIRDLRSLAWSSIDNKETRDVDQIEQSEATSGGTLVRVAIADVDEYVPRGSAVDKLAAQNTVSVYAGDVLQPMLPVALSEGATSLLAGQDRLAIVAEFVIGDDGSLRDKTVYRALVRNVVQLDYVTVGAWLSGKGALPQKAQVMEEQLRMQYDASLRLHRERIRLGALEFERRETTPVLRDGVVVDIELTDKGPARDLIEDLMIAANSVIAGFLEDANVSWIRRMVGAPERWPKIMEIASEHGVRLPASPDRKALGDFLQQQREKEPAKFADLSLSVLRLLGSGSYVVEHRAEELEAHFALGVQDYTHFTAPNRRYADIVTQRIVKSVLAGQPVPYSDAELETIAKQCTEMEDKAKGVERKVDKLASLQLMSSRVGQSFDAVIAAAHDHGVVAMVKSPAVEVRIPASQNLRAGQHVRVQVTKVDMEHSAVDGQLLVTKK